MKDTKANAKIKLLRLRMVLNTRFFRGKRKG